MSSGVLLVAQVFRFCAIPQVMAIGTLAMCYNNHEVFTGILRINPPNLTHPEASGFVT